MSSTISTRLDGHHEDRQDQDAGVSRSEPGGRAQRRAGAPRCPDAHPEMGERASRICCPIR
jgi:hypothetical protein